MDSKIKNPPSKPFVLVTSTDGDLSPHCFSLYRQLRPAASSSLWCVLNAKGTGHFHVSQPLQPDTTEQWDNLPTLKAATTMGPKHRCHLPSISQSWLLPPGTKHKSCLCSHGLQGCFTNLAASQVGKPWTHAAPVETVKNSSPYLPASFQTLLQSSALAQELL